MYKREVIGENIRKLRLQRGLTQENLAERLSVLQNSKKGGSPQTISRIENAVNDFGIDTFLAVAEALEVKPEYLLSNGYMEHEIAVTERLEERMVIMMNVLNQITAIVNQLLSAIQK